MSTPSATALVIGGGVIGYAGALALQRAGWRVTLVAPDEPTAPPSWGNAGHIATEQVEPLATLATLRSALRRWHRFGGPLDLRQPWRHRAWLRRYLRACMPARAAAGRVALAGLLADALPAWRRLAAAIDASDLLLEHGHWLCWESARSAARGSAAWQGADLGTARCAPLPAAQREALQAELGVPLAGALGFEHTAQIADLPTLARRLELALVRGGGTIVRSRVQALQASGVRVQALDAGGVRRDADVILVCAGLHSRGLLAGLGLPAPLIAERGYHLQWTRHDWPALPPVVFEDRSVILTRFSSGLRLAGHVEYAVPDAAPDPRKWARLARHAAQLGLPVRGEPSAWFGARPTLPDYLPALGVADAYDNLAYAFGHQHLGLTLAATTGERIARACMQGGPRTELAPFGLARFG
ncbi:FAD-binding oxidoreductase [Dokdonella sp.]|uniref:NAD(P)/FAD-dependent oxidoreductase n=1 Tax=Dokdonella sp. TaxID=2291710 RepID=UPI0027B94E93|nr:FAD-binding oxidoreductase [Dokdonella sp.]